MITTKRLRNYYTNQHTDPSPMIPLISKKTKLISLLKSIKTEGGINESTYKRL